MQWSGVEWPGVPILGEEQDLCTHTTPIHTRQTVGHQLLRLLDRVVLTYSGTGSQPGGVDALLNHFARNDEGTIRSVLPGEHAPADRNRLGSVNAANVPNFERDDGLRRLCAIPTGGARYRQADEREIGTGILRFTDYLFAFAVPVGSAFRAGDADWQARKNRSAVRRSCRPCRRRYSAAFDGASWSPAAPAGSRGQKVNRGT
jgi:hypothetical protein